MRSGKVEAFNASSGRGQIRENCSTIRRFSCAIGQLRGFQIDGEGKVIFKTREGKRAPDRGDEVWFSTSSDRVVGWAFADELTPRMLGLLKQAGQELRESELEASIVRRW